MYHKDVKVEAFIYREKRGFLVKYKLLFFFHYIKNGRKNISPSTVVQSASFFIWSFQKSDQARSTFQCVINFLIVQQVSVFTKIIFKRELEKRLSPSSGALSELNREMTVDVLESRIKYSLFLRVYPFSKIMKIRPVYL